MGLRKKKRKHKDKKKNPGEIEVEKADLVEETDPEVLFATDEGETQGEGYISTCSGCGATVTRGEYKCPKCGKLLI